MLGGLGSAELLVIGVVLLVLFGGKKLNELARGLGESSKELRTLKKNYDNALNSDEPVMKSVKKKKVEDKVEGEN